MRSLLLALVLSACAHHVGDVCNAGEAFCGGLKDDPKGMLQCKSGQLARFDCAGPAGCHRDEARGIFCDQSSGAIPDSPCLPEYAGRGQCAGIALIQCTEGFWNTLACSPGKHCVQVAGNVTCQ